MERTYRCRLAALVFEPEARHDSTVLLYGRNLCAAARAAHLLLCAEVRDVRLLDGGFAALPQAPVAGRRLRPPLREVRLFRLARST